jgi:4-amino-4-deoxy-L-arabinose transferase-like glycosyltransferase
MPILKSKPLQRVGSSLISPFVATWRWLHWLGAVQNRERIRLWNEMVQIQGLMPLLMKQRNGYQWTDEDRRQIRMQLDKLASLSPYLILFLIPGGFFALPLLAWWLDRRRLKRANEARQRITK